MTALAHIGARFEEAPDATAGFTLVEMLVVLAIIALVAAAAAPGLANRYRTTGVEASANEIIARFRASRTLAIASAKPQRIVVDPQAKTIQFDERHTINLAQDVMMVVTTGQETTINERQTVLTFLPNGSASGLEMDLKQKGHSVRIEVNWLSGLSSLRTMP